MTTRAIMIPVQMWSNPIWAQFVADTIPEMTFASAWTLLVSFFVQLVGVASGSGTSASPGLVIQITAYVVYAVVMGTYFWNPVASVLLYALLCCIYAALFGTTMYFCPRLLLLLQPGLAQNSGLAVRLAASSFLCVFVFGARTFGFARKVVAPPEVVQWWWQYGALELIPSILFLMIMHPKSPVPPNSEINDDNDNTTRGNSSSARSGGSNRSSSPGSTGATPPTPSSSTARKRQDDSYATSSRRSTSETTPLLKPGSIYGANPAVAVSAGDASAS